MSSTFHGTSYHWRNRYLLMRHGHSQANQQALIISTPERGLDAFGLSPKGERQLDDVLNDWTWPTPTRVFHSDFLRTTHTAQRVAQSFKLSMEKEPRLRERAFGEFEGGSDSAYPGVWALDNESAEHKAHGVEPVSQVAARMLAVIEEMECRFEGEVIALVSHGDPLQILLTALNDRPLTKHREQPALAPASITLIGASSGA